MKINEIRGIYFYKYKRGLKASETARNMNEGFGPNTTIVQRWFKRFRNGNDHFGDEVHSNRVSAHDNDKLNVLIEADPLTTLRDICRTHPTVLKQVKAKGKTKT